MITINCKTANWSKKIKFPINVKFDEVQKIIKNFDSGIAKFFQIVSVNDIICSETDHKIFINEYASHMYDGYDYEVIFVAKIIGV